MIRRLIAALLLPATLLAEEAAPKKADMVVLDEVSARNLRIETQPAEETDFEEIAFALGRIRVAPGHRAVVSSRIPGRAVEVKVHVDTRVEKGAEAVILESRQPGDPPPRVPLTAPLTGLVAAVNVVPGQPVTPDDSLIEIVNLREVHAVAAVPEHLAGRLRVGQLAHVRVSVAPGRIFAADLAHLGAEADRESGTLEAAFHVDNPDTLLRPGMRAEFSIVLGKRTGVMSVPRAALQGDAAHRFVYIEDYDLPFAYVKCPVVTGEMNDRFVEITSGLFPGDRVVTRGAYSLAFAGSGSVSLKEALDAAHGHEHAADGSEMKPGAHDDHANHEEGAPHAHEDEHGGRGPLFWQLTSGALLLLLIVSVATRPAAPVGEKR